MQESSAINSEFIFRTFYSRSKYSIRQLFGIVAQIEYKEVWVSKAQREKEEAPSKKNRGRAREKMKLVSVVLFLLLYFTRIGQVTEITRFNSPRNNIWVTIANQTNQSSLCLSLGGITNPFRTCLIGLPVWPPNEFCGLVKNQTWCSHNVTTINSSTPEHNKYQNDGFRQCQIVLSLNTSLLSPPEELDLFGCANASMTNTSQGGWFSFVPFNNRNWSQNKKHWATLNSVLGMDKVTGMVYTSCNSSSLQTPRKLPPGIFLICGDRA